MFEQLLEAIARGLERLGLPYLKVLAGRPCGLEDVRSILLKNPGFAGGADIVFHVCALTKGTASARGHRRFC